MHQTTGDILSFGLELFIDQSLLNNHMKLIKFSSNRLDLKIYSVNQNDSGLYTCMINHQKLAAFLLEIFSKFIQILLNKLSIIHFNNFLKQTPSNCIRFFLVKYTLQTKR
jgi:hypothetical protein